MPCAIRSAHLQAPIQVPLLHTQLGSQGMVRQQPASGLPPWRQLQQEQGQHQQHRPSNAVCRCPGCPGARHRGLCRGAAHKVRARGLDET